MTVESFGFTGATGTAVNFARIDPTPAGFGTGHVIRYNNINTNFDFAGLSPGVTQVVFRLADMGGSENLSVNGLPMPVFAGELTAAPATMGGAVVSSNATVSPGCEAGWIGCDAPARNDHSPACRRAGVDARRYLFQVRSPSGHAVNETSIRAGRAVAASVGWSSRFDTAPLHDHIHRLVNDEWLGASRILESLATGHPHGLGQGPQSQ